MGGTANVPAAGDNEDQDSPKPSVLGVPLTRWAIAAVSAIVVIYAAIHFGVKAYTETIQVHDGESAYSQAVIKEMVAHKTDKSGQTTVIHDGSDGKILATYFSDGCIAIQRPGDPLPYLTQPEAHVEWSLAPSRRPSSQAPEKITAEPIWGLIFGRAGQHGVPGSDLPRAATDDPVLAAEVVSFPSDDGPLRPVQVGCLNPHPWAFQGSWGPANGCWVPFWRRWNDGCTHYQMYNTCSGQWDPAVHWTFCAGQHHP